MAPEYTNVEVTDEYLREIEDERRRAVTRGGPKR